MPVFVCCAPKEYFFIVALRPDCSFVRANKRMASHDTHITQRRSNGREPY